ncbi:glycoside hydrolase family 36 N-terminal domain-containing protein [Streptomyces sp. NPDC059690]|uniref:glycoside hydrolase family 36 N-terminal domain-containing protein n=1 Tax=Streptomyces sp. NPDC059690 TaxID=3346907 RepID=UPI0036AB8660
MTPPRRWTLRTDHTSYTVRLSPDGPWAELEAWGPHGVEDGPSALDWSHRTHFITTSDAAPAEYLPHGLRPFCEADLVAARPGSERGVWWTFTGAEQNDDGLRLTFTDDVLGLRTTLCYATVPGTDVLHRWTELTCTGEEPLRLERIDSAAVTVPVTTTARLTYLTGQWSQEFQRTRLDLDRGTFTMGSTQGAPGHAYAPWLAVQDAGQPDAAYGIALEWPGNWHISAQAEPGGTVRLRAGRVPHEGVVHLAPGETLTTPRAACAFSADGLTGLSRAWHRYERLLAGERLHRPRKVLYNSWEATGFDVDAAGQLELAKAAADIGADLREWGPGQRAEAARWVARYKEVRDVIHHGDAHLLGTPEDPTCGVQYDAPDGSRTVVAAFSTGRLDGAPLLPGRAARLRLRGLDPAARYDDAASGVTYAGAHLLHYGLPFAWSADHDAELVVLTRHPAG